MNFGPWMAQGPYLVFAGACVILIAAFLAYMRWGDGRALGQRKILSGRATGDHPRA